ncbi:hypothetical protein GCM10009773_38520 [Williamsia serinedens]
MRALNNVQWASNDGHIGQHETARTSDGRAYDCADPGRPSQQYVGRGWPPISYRGWKALPGGRRWPTNSGEGGRSPACNYDQ